MAIAGDLEQARAALTMIQAEPFNAEAPLEALAGSITPSELHFVRSNFALPVHDGTLEVGGAVDSLNHADARGPARHASGRAGRDPRVCGERASSR